MKKPSTGEDKDEKKDENNQKEGGNNDDKGKESNVQEKKFKPTVPKKEFVSNFIFSLCQIGLTSSLLTFSSL